MPKAMNLIEAYNNFVVEPLKTEEEFRDFYVERPKGAPSPIEELKDRIENSESAKKYLFLGFRGCGKSTELNRLLRLLDKDKFLIVSYSIRELDVSDFDFRDFFASMALKIYDTAEKEIELERDIKEDFRDFMMHITKVSEQAEDFFYKNYGLLIQPNCFVIYTFPIPLTFNPYYENVRHSFDADIILPQLPVRSKNRKKKNEENVNFYKRIVDKRMELDLIEENALEGAILSTGKTSEFVSVMRDAAIKAHRNEREKITNEEIGNVLEKLRRTYDRTLTEAHKKRLLDIYDKQEARDENTGDFISRDLLFSLTAVEYEDEEGRWCDINPLLMPLVEKWKKAK